MLKLYKDVNGAPLVITHGKALHCSIKAATEASCQQQVTGLCISRTTFKERATEDNLGLRLHVFGFRFEA